MSDREIESLQVVSIEIGDRLKSPDGKVVEKVSKKIELTDGLLPSYPVREDWAWKGESPWIESIHFFLTDQTFKTAIKIYRFCSFIKSVPFELEPKSKEKGTDDGPCLRVRPFQHWWQKALWHLVNWLIFGIIFFEYVSFYFLWQRASFGKEIAFHIQYLVYYSWVFVYFLPLYQKPNECIVMLNQHDFIVRHANKLGMGNKHWASHLFVILAVYYLAYTLACTVLIVTGFFLRSPERSQYLYSVFPDAWKEGSQILYMVCALLELFWFSCGSSLLCLYFCFWCADIYTINSSLKELMKQKVMTQTSIDAYLYLELFCVSFNDFNGGLFSTGFCFVLLATPVLLIYMSLTTFEMLSLFIYLIAPVFSIFLIGLILLFLPQHSKVHSRSTDLLARLDRLPIDSGPQVYDTPSTTTTSMRLSLSHLSPQERRAYFQKRVKAFRPLRIQISFFCSFSLTTPAVLMDQIFNNILLLLSL